MYKIKLSPYTKLFYIEWLLNPNSSRYNVVYDQILHGKIDPERLRRCLIRYVLDHVLLSSHIIDINGEPYWQQNSEVLELEYEASAKGADSDLIGYVSKPFDLNSGPLYRFKLIRIDDQTFRFIVVLHHIIMDGSSLNEGVFNSVSTYYNEHNYTNNVTTAEQIKNLVTLEKEFSANIQTHEQHYKKFWRKQLDSIETANLDFLKIVQPNNNPTEKISKPSVNEVRFELGKADTLKLQKIKKQHNITPYRLGLAVFALVVYKHSGQNNFAINYPLAINGGTDFIYGAQLNTNLVPFRFEKLNKISDLVSFIEDFFHHIKRDTIKQGYYPISNIIRETNADLLNLSYLQSNLRDTNYSFEGINEVEIISNLYVDSIPSKGIIFEQEPIVDLIKFRVRYYADDFDETLVNNFILCYRRIYDEIILDLLHGNFEKSIESYRLLNDEQHHHLVYGLNHQIGNYAQNKPLHVLFEEQAAKRPTQIALEYNNQKLSYCELNSKANQLAHHIQSQCGSTNNEIIAVALNRNLDLIITILAILKSGAAYTPLTPDYPNERCNYILSEANPRIIITNKPYKDKFSKHCEYLLLIDDEKFRQAIVNEPQSNLNHPFSPKNVAYVLYTSGTTGKPKGVVQPHKNVVRLFSATHKKFKFTENDVWIMLHSYVFDFSVWEIWGALLFGGTLIIPSVEQVKDPQSLFYLCHDKGVTVLNQTPKYFVRLSDVAHANYSKTKLSKLRYIVFGGDKLNLNSLESWAQLYGYDKPKLINMYGITETTVHVTYKEVNKEDFNKGSIIGSNIPDQKLYVLDKDLKPVPYGVIGELYVGGAGLAIKYLKKPAITNKCFIPNPYQSDEECLCGENTKLYKTGDLVRRLPNTELEYIGRNDSQVKIQGHRVELSGIESTLMGFPGISQATVLKKEKLYSGSDKRNDYLVAYYLSKEFIDESALQIHLALNLPEYMQPNYVMRLEQFPLTINGKIDIKSLPEPVFHSTKEFMPPKNEEETIVCKVFSDVLHIAQISSDDDFFKLGGNSLDAIQIATILQTKSNIKVADVFNYRTPSSIAKHIKFGSDSLQSTLNRIIINSTSEDPKPASNGSLLKRKIDHYNKYVETYAFDSKKLDNLETILLTGATGYLGCNLLHQLLTTTQYNLFLIIRGEEEQAFEKIAHKYLYYFNNQITQYLDTRVTIVNGDIEKPLLGLSASDYSKLANKIDCVIHAAALVKHYGESDKFYSANVQATIHLLEFSKLARQNIFHYISTNSVLNYSKQKNTTTFTEFDDPLDVPLPEHIYVKTKLQAECEVIKYRQYGVSSSIYRVGNLGFMKNNIRPQENLHENAFYNWLQYLLSSKQIAHEIANVEISLADSTAQAIIRIFDKSELHNQIHHVFNPNLFNLVHFFKNHAHYAIKDVSLETFVNHAKESLFSSHTYQDLTLKFLLRQGWLDGHNLATFATILIKQDKTLKILKQLGFEWSTITESMFDNFLEETDRKKVIA